MTQTKEINELWRTATKAQLNLLLISFFGGLPPWEGLRHRVKGVLTHYQPDCLRKKLASFSLYFSINMKQDINISNDPEFNGKRSCTKALDAAVATHRMCTYLLFFLILHLTNIYIIYSSVFFFF